MSHLLYANSHKSITKATAMIGLTVIYVLFGMPQFNFLFDFTKIWPPLKRKKKKKKKKEAICLIRNFGRFPALLSLCARIA